MATPSIVRDVDELTFAQDVIERSRTVPVVVDFWAPWCGPCRLLGPMLEAAVTSYGGQIELAKLNTDENPALAEQFGIEGIPAVKAFVDGRLATEFTGALPEPQVRAFLQSLLPSKADQLAESAARLAYAGDQDGAERAYGEALVQDSAHRAANIGLALLLIARGEEDEALKLLQRLPGDPEATRLRSEISLRRAAGDVSIADLQARVTADPTDVDALYRLAVALAAQQQYEQALEYLLEVVRRDRAYQDDGGRKMMLEIFALLGDSNPLTQRYRRQLSSILF